MNKIQKIILTSSILLLAPLAALASTLNLSPASGSYAVGSTFNVDILLDTKGAAVDGVDLYYVHFNPALLQVVDANTSASGVQILAGKLFSQTAANSVNQSAGTIMFSQVTSGGSKYTGSGKLATVTFKAIAAGTAKVSFDFTLGKTSDTNVAGKGVDTLTSVNSGTYILTGTASTTTTTPETSTNTNQSMTQTPDQSQTQTAPQTPQTGGYSNPTTSSESSNTKLYLMIFGGLIVLGILIYFIKKGTSASIK
jgi:hypothetical protein